MSATEKMSKRREKRRRKQKKFSIVDTIFFIFACSLVIGALYYFFYHRDQDTTVIKDKSKAVPKAKNEKPNTRPENSIIKDKVKKDEGKKKDNTIKPKTKVMPAENEKIQEPGKDKDNSSNDNGNINTEIKEEEPPNTIEDSHDDNDNYNSNNDNSINTSVKVGDKPKEEEKPKEETEIISPSLANTPALVEKDMLNYGELPPLFLAIKNDTIKVFEDAIKGKTNIGDERSGAGFNLLQYAAALLRVDIMRFIIENNLLKIEDVIKDGEYAGNTALHFACLAAEIYPDRAIEAVELLLNNNADINARDSNGFTPIFCAVQSGHVKLVEYLLAKDASLIKSRAVDDNSTLLHFAMDSCKRPMIKLLIDKDADMMHAVNDFNREPIHEAAALGCVDGLKELILTRMVSKQHKSPARNDKTFKQQYRNAYLFGASPLHFAAKFGKLDAVEFLFLIQANYYAEDDNKNMAVYYAKQNRNREIEKYFYDRRDWESKRSTNQDIEFLLRDAEENFSPAEIEDFYSELRRTDLHK